MRKRCNSRRINRGVYILIINLSKNKKIRIGSVGIISFRRGVYLYVGSAQNNLIARIARHFNQEKKLYWHIDYLLKYSRINGIICLINQDKTKECEIAHKLTQRLEIINNFGASDCKCKGHLFYVKECF